MFKFKKGVAIALTAVMSMSLAVGCAGDKKEDTKTDSGEKQIKIAMVTDTGGVNDQSFNQSAWEGLKKAEEELNIKPSYKESKQDADYIPNLETLLDAENDLIWGIGFKMGDAMLEAAKQNPDQKYAIIDFSYGDETPSNIVGVTFKAEEPSFLVGYIAAKMSKTGKVGFVGGMDVPIINAFQYGFEAGAKYANPEIEIFEQFAESFNDAGKGKAIANQMFQQGADIVFHAAGGVGDGVIEAAKEKGLYAIGVDRDQNYLAPDTVITSAMKLVGNAMYNIAEDLQKGEFPGGTTVEYGIKEGGVGIAPTSDKHVPADILEEVKALEKKIIDGEIVVPKDKAGFESFQAN